MDLCLRNETSVSPECVGAQTDALQSGGNGSLETSSNGSNVSAALIPQRMREKGEWTSAQLEAASTLQTICPKAHTFLENIRTRQTANLHRKQGGKSDSWLQTWIRVAWQRERVSHAPRWLLVFVLFSESGTGGKVCHDRIQILSIAWPRCFLLLARLIPVSIFEAFPSLLSKILILPGDLEIWGYNWFWHYAKGEKSGEKSHIALYQRLVPFTKP